MYTAGDRQRACYVAHVVVTLSKAREGRSSVSAHTQFTLLALLGGALTAPALVAAWMLRLPDRQLATGSYGAGCVLIAGALVLDPIIQPPLFYHGFVPGLGIAAMAIALALVAGSLRRRSTLRPHADELVERLD